MLARGYSREIIARNIRALIRDEKLPPDRASAMAHSEARRWFRHFNPGARLPAYLEPKRNPMKKEILIYAIPKGETERFTEDLISSHCKTAADIAAVKAAASKDGWHSFRVAHWDGRAPDFTKTINQKNPIRGASARAKRLYSGFMLRPVKSGRVVNVKPIPKEALDIGKVIALEYASSRGGVVKHYRHEFKVSARPLLAVSTDGRSLMLLGGAYRFTNRGIVDD